MNFSRARKPLSPGAQPMASPNLRAALTRDGEAATSQEDEILIAVVGVTGSGKSSFIKRATGRDDVEIGEGLASMTQNVREYSCTIAGRKFKLIDTPGFDDTEVDDEDIFEALTDWLAKSYRKQQRLTGLLYLHRIISNREKGSDLRNLRVFQKLCGDQSLSNVIIGITWWDKEDAEVVSSREKVLKESDEFWGDMVKKGAQVARMPLDQSGCIDLLMNLSTRHTTTLAVQDEIVNQGKDASHTDAASVLIRYDKQHAARDSDRLDRLARDLRMKAQRLKREQDAARALAEERARYEEEDERLLAEHEALLLQKKKEADEFRRRTEARRKRMEEIQRELREAEDDINTMNRGDSDFATPSRQANDSPPPAYDSGHVSQTELSSTSRDAHVEYERSRPVTKDRETISTASHLPTQEMDNTRTVVEAEDKSGDKDQAQDEALRLEEERRAKILADQIRSHKKAQAEAQQREEEEKQKEKLRLEEARRAKVLAEQMQSYRKAQAEERQREAEKLEKEHLQRVAEEKRRAEEEEQERAEEERAEQERIRQRERFQAAVMLLAREQEEQRAREEEQARALEAYQQEVLDTFSNLLLRSLSPQTQPQTQSPPQSGPARELALTTRRTQRRLDTLQQAIRQFSACTRLHLFTQPWQGIYHAVDGVRMPGPLQDAWCDICMAPLPNLQGHWSCNECVMESAGTLAMCHQCKVERQGKCFSTTHSPLRFTPFQSADSPGPYTTCVRLRSRCLFNNMNCSKCLRVLSTIYLHCCQCDNDDFDLCMDCSTIKFPWCRAFGHTLWVHTWTPPSERRLLEA